MPSAWKVSRSRPRASTRRLAKFGVLFRIDAAGKAEQIDLRAHSDLLHEVDQDQVEILFVLGPDHCVIDPLSAIFSIGLPVRCASADAPNRLTLLLLV